MSRLRPGAAGVQGANPCLHRRVAGVLAALRPGLDDRVGPSGRSPARPTRRRCLRRAASGQAAGSRGAVGRRSSDGPLCGPRARSRAARRADTRPKASAPDPGPPLAGPAETHRHAHRARPLVRPRCGRARGQRRGLGARCVGCLGAPPRDGEKLARRRVPEDLAHAGTRLVVRPSMRKGRHDPGLLPKLSTALLARRGGIPRRVPPVHATASPHCSRGGRCRVFVVRHRRSVAGGARGARHGIGDPQPSVRATMSDEHIRALRAIVRDRVRTLKAHSPRRGESGARASARRQDLVRLSARARARLTAAEVRQRAAQDQG
jgi:hypothetical protein